ncbi:MAG: sulfur reduction protein DsrE [Betaproteobacteria bacterium]|nr:sulfur reduction protein DsrE [Betaproteobacteria bacterium]
MKQKHFAALVLAVTGFFGAWATGVAHAGDQPWVNPTIKEAGKIVALPDAGLQPDRMTDYKVVFNIPHNGPADKILPGLERVARTVNLFTSAGVPLSHLHFVAVVHGGATPAILTDEHYKDKFGIANPNTALIAELDRAGVKVVVCGQALAHNDFPQSWVNPKVEVTLAALVDVVVLQKQGYVLVPL